MAQLCRLFGGFRNRTDFGNDRHVISYVIFATSATLATVELSVLLSGSNSTDF
jgi:hypothetical protein